MDKPAVAIPTTTTLSRGLVHLKSSFNTENGMIERRSGFDSKMRKSLNGGRVVHSIKEALLGFLSL